MAKSSGVDQKTFRFIEKTADLVNTPVKPGVVLVRKMKTFIKRLDLDNDGSITKKDLELVAERYAQLTNLDPEEAKQGLQQLQMAWDTVLKLEEQDGKIDPERLASAAMRSGRDMVIALLAIHSSFIFNFLDRDKSGFISKPELRLYHQMLNLNDAKLTDECFDIMDEDKDGHISFMEFVQAVIDYFISNDINSPYNVLFGPLVD